MALHAPGSLPGPRPLVAILGVLVAANLAGVTQGAAADPSAPDSSGSGCSLVAVVDHQDATAEGSAVSSPSADELSAGRWQRTARAPFGTDVDLSAWTGDRMIVTDWSTGRTASYDPRQDRWRSRATAPAFGRLDRPRRLDGPRARHRRGGRRWPRPLRPRLWVRGGPLARARASAGGLRRSGPRARPSGLDRQPCHRRRRPRDGGRLRPCRGLLAGTPAGPRRWHRRGRRTGRARSSSWSRGARRTE